MASFPLSFPATLGADRPKMSELVDTFITEDDAKWGFTQAAVTGNHLVLTPNSSSNARAYSAAAYDLTESRMAAQLTQAQAVDSTWFYVQNAASLYSGFAVINGNLQFVEYVGGAENDTSTTYDPVLHRWLQLRESGGVLYWETSIDGITWNPQRSKSVGRLYNDEHAAMFAGGASGVSMFANFNRTPHAPPTVPDVSRTKLNDISGISDSVMRQFMQRFAAAAVTSSTPTPPTVQTDPRSAYNFLRAKS